MCARIDDTYQDTATASRSRMATILCIDDDPDIAGTIALRLRQYEVNVLAAFHGMQGFAIASREKPDVIITDLRMPMGEGEFVLDSLKRNSQTAHIPVIVLSGQRGDDLPGRVHRLGAVRFFRKPVLFEQLLEELSRYIPLREREQAETVEVG